jgi:signal transduction histidine kinase/CheY-like chemotaxis protein/HPt (histidine-containing phosphotransfer) domain-containing protein/HAMP domain-containing protein
MSIKAKFIIPTTIIIILIAAAILATNIFSFSNYIDDSMADRLKEDSKVVKSGMEDTVMSAEVFAKQLSEDTGIRTWLAENNRDNLIDEFKPLLNESSQAVGNYIMTDAKGNVLLNTNELEKFGHSLLSEDTIRAAVEGQSMTVFKDQPESRFYIQASCPVYNDQGVIVGTMTAVSYLADSKNIAIDSFKNVIGCEASFFAGDECVATTLLDNDGKRAVGTKVDSEIAQQVLAGTPYIGHIESFGRPLYGQYEPIKDPNEKVVGMIFFGHYLEDAQKVTEAFVRGGLIITLFMLVVSIVIILIIVSRIATPIQTMTKAASALAVGDTELDIHVNTKDEMKTLADAFNSIVNNTRQQIALVQDIASGNLNLSLESTSNIEITQNEESGEMEATILPRSDKDEMNRALEQLNTTIRVQAAELRKEHFRIQLLLDTNPLACRLWDQDIQLLECNEAAVKLFGLKDKQEYISRYFELTPEFQPDGRISQEKIKEMVQEAFDKGACRYNFTYQLLDGSPLPTEVTLVRVPYGSSHVVAAYSRDLREQLKMLSEINETSKQLETALFDAEVANHAKGDFLASMSHEMRTPLNAIIGLSDIALGDDMLSDESVSYIEKIHNSGTTLLSIVNDILDLSKIQSGKFEILPHEYDVPSTINDSVIQNVLRIGSKPIRFNLEIDENLYACLFGDELRIKQIINNLISNAIKYTEAGSVTLTIRHEREGDFVWMTIAVADTGVGMKEEHLKKLFTDFVQFGSTSKSQAGGTGLGLSITKSLIEMMDGEISVESTFGVGSTFTAKLRQGFVKDTVIGTEVAKNISSFQYSANKLEHKNRPVRIKLPYARVLIVDDNTTNLDVAKGLMKPYAMKMDCVTSGQEAIDVIRDFKVKYDAIFMDHMMPEMNGLEATQFIREEIGTDYARNIPIIALTANAIAGNEEMFLKKGFQDFISKPIDIKKLDAVIHRWLRNKELEKKYGDAYQEPTQSDTEHTFWNENNTTLDGIDIKGALERYNGDEEILTGILRSYASNTRAILKELNTFLSAERLEDYTIAVHGVKGTSYSILAQEVGTMAEELENASKAGDMEKVKSIHPSFQDSTEKLLDELDQLLLKMDTAKNAPVLDQATRPERRRFDFTAPEAKILIVDDNETNLIVALGLLKPLLMKMDTAENGQAALKRIAEKEYDLIFMDQLMPVMDGIEATKKLRQMDGDYCKQVPIIALSASNSSEARDTFLKAGMNDFVTKPIEIQEIQTKLKKWLPQGLITENQSLSPQTDTTVEPAVTDLPDIEGIDTKEGLRYSGSKELLEELLGNFYKLIDIKANKIEKCLADGLVRDVTIEVHALKSTARMIGAGELSQEFAQLEEYGKEENVAALERDIPDVLAHYRSYKAALKRFGEAADSEKRQADNDELITLLKELQAAMDTFDLDGADDAMKQLDKLRVPEECNNQMETLRAYVADVAMEEVISLAEDLIKILQNKL